MIKTTLELLLALSAAGSVVTLSLLLLRLVPDERLSSTWRYRIGKMALLFYLFPVAPIVMLIKPVFVSLVSVPYLPNGQTAQSSAHANPTEQVTAIGGSLPQEAVLSVSAHAAWLILGIWAAGSLFYAAWQVHVYRKISRVLIQTSFPVPADDEAQVRLSALVEELGLDRRKSKQLSLSRNPLLRSPVVAGLHRPTIYLPTSMTGEADMALRHELIHLRRGDLPIKLLTLAAVSLHWFNPLAHLARRDIHLWSELSCDAEVVKDMSREERKHYGQALIAAAAGADRLHAGFFAPLSGDGKQLKRRLSLMLNMKKVKKKTVVLASAAVLTVATLSTTAAVWAAENTPNVSEAVTVPAESLGIASSDSPDTVPKAAKTVPGVFLPASVTVPAEDPSESKQSAAAVPAPTDQIEARETPAEVDDLPATVPAGMNDLTVSEAAPSDEMVAADSAVSATTPVADSTSAAEQPAESPVRPDRAAATEAVTEPAAAPTP